jgi:hypothetical protein
MNRAIKTAIVRPVFFQQRRVFCDCKVPVQSACREVKVYFDSFAKRSENRFLVGAIEIPAVPVFRKTSRSISGKEKKLSRFAPRHS